MDIAIVVSSCDQFRDAWAPFFHFFFKFWPDCPYPCFLLTNYGIYTDPRVTCLTLGRDRHWATNLLLALDRIPARRIIYFQEDFFLTRRVRTDVLQEDIRFMEVHNAASLCLIPPPDANELADFAEYHPNLAKVADSARLRVCLQAAVWQVAALKSLLRTGETGWDMEKFGSARSRGMLLLRVQTRELSSLDYLRTAIVRGAWEPDAVAMCSQDGIKLDLAFRSVRPQTKSQRRKQRWRVRWERFCQALMPRRFEISPLSASKLSEP
jgi:hypothetical protein